MYNGSKLNIKNLRSWHPVPLLHDKYMWEEWKHRHILFSWCSIIAVNGDYNHEIKRHLLLGRKAIPSLIQWT